MAGNSHKDLSKGDIITVTAVLGFKWIGEVVEDWTSEDGMWVKVKGTGEHANGTVNVYRGDIIGA